ncbi:MAG TPA: helix-turn-helix transcriptional regulator [Vicinamibacterales bacterium]|nr:helix-turn-helix transcriptional regulator [Vicinamibacterales bacterium]
MAPIYLGEFEYAVMLATLHLDQEAYAVPIRELIEQRTGRPVARGALYTGLERLEAKGCLRSRMGDPTDERGGKARRYYTVTAAGMKALRATHESLASLTRGLESILEQP